MMAERYVLVAHVQSKSGSTPWPVKTDGKRLTCACPGWTRRIAPDGSRTCRHTEAVTERLTQAGLSMARAMQMADSLSTILGPEAGVDPIHAEAVSLADQYWHSSDSPTRMAEAIEASIRKFAGRPLAPAPVAPRPTWLGRAIILRE